jgi:hypothetical protein
MWPVMLSLTFFGIVAGRQNRQSRSRSAFDMVWRALPVPLHDSRKVKNGVVRPLIHRALLGRQEISQRGQSLSDRVSSRLPRDE